MQVTTSDLAYIHERRTVSEDTMDTASAFVGSARKALNNLLGLGTPDPGDTPAEPDVEKVAGTGVFSFLLDQFVIRAIQNNCRRRHGNNRKGLVSDHLTPSR